jgi:hypothetical protein
MMAAPCGAALSGSMVLERGVLEHWTSEAVSIGREVTDSIRIESSGVETIVVRTRGLC